MMIGIIRMSNLQILTTVIVYFICMAQFKNKYKKQIKFRETNMTSNKKSLLHAAGLAALHTTT